VLCGDRELVHRYRSAGARFIAVGVDSLLLAAATSGLAASYKHGEPYAGPGWVLSFERLCPSGPAFPCLAYRWPGLGPAAD
jgi:hypothetical protein